MPTDVISHRLYFYLMSRRVQVAYLLRVNAFLTFQRDFSLSASAFSKHAKSSLDMHSRQTRPSVLMSREQDMSSVFVHSSVAR